ncbi:histidine kinase N-terminal 7TM domain-containing diguanylate cyclase [Cereibacter johrii]|uniref:histidine kinase N-terminal 7TM domain-containing diguanylate cyclase n=1 Tax=Cereibacter johrii TaxID=445629 RepID=UPI003CEE45BD
MDPTHCLRSLNIDAAVFVAASTFLGFSLLTAWLLRQEYFFGREYFLSAVCGVIWWLAFAGLEMATPGLTCKMAFSSMAWPAIALVPVSWFFFLRHYCQGGRIGGRRLEVGLLGAVVVSVTAIVATNPWHGLFYLPGTRLAVIDGRLSALFLHGPLFHAATALLYVFLLFSVGIAAFGAFRAARAQRPMLMMLLFGTLAPIVANLAYVLFKATVFGFDPTPFAFAFVLLVLTWAIYGNRTFDLTTVARDLIYFNVADPVLVVTARGQIAGLNPAASLLMPELAPGTALDPAGPFASLLELMEKGERPSRPREPVEIGGRTLDIRFLPIWRPLGTGRALLGAVALMTDTTELRRNAARLEAALAQSRDRLAEITRLREAAEASARSDPLTGLGNRRALDRHFEAATEREGAIALALIDIDHFKQINDRLGHAMGDRVLQRFAAELSAVLPEGARAFRIGGEEFLTLCPGQDTGAVVDLLEKLARRLEADPPLRDGDLPRLTFSAGVAMRPGDGRSLGQLTARADARLYEAKRQGRNLVLHLDAGRREAADAAAALSGPARPASA